MLMVSVSGIVGGILLPYLSHDWEAGARPAVAAKLNLAIKLLGVAMFAGSALVLLGVAAAVRRRISRQIRRRAGDSSLDAHLLHLDGPGAAGANVFVVRRTGAVADVCLDRRPDYERRAVPIAACPDSGCMASFGATCAANLVTLVIMFQFNRAFGMRIDGGTWLVILLPLVLGLGQWATLSVTVVLGNRDFDGGPDFYSRRQAAIHRHLPALRPRSDFPALTRSVSFEVALFAQLAVKLVLSTKRVLSHD